MLVRILVESEANIHVCMKASMRYRDGCAVSAAIYEMHWKGRLKPGLMTSGHEKICNRIAGDYML